MRHSFGRAIEIGFCLVLVGGLALGQTGPAGGDLAGNYPNPTVAGVNNASVTATGTSTPRTIPDITADRLNIKSFGAKGDWLQGFTDGAITAGTTAFTSNSANFTSNDCHTDVGCTGPVDKVIVLSGLGTPVSGYPIGFQTTIVKVNGAHSIVLASAPPNSSPTSQIVTWSVVSPQML